MKSITTILLCLVSLAASAETVIYQSKSEEVFNDPGVALLSMFLGYGDGKHPSTTTVTRIDGGHFRFDIDYATQSTTGTLHSPVYYPGKYVMFDYTAPDGTEKKAVFTPGKFMVDGLFDVTLTEPEKFADLERNIRKAPGAREDRSLSKFMLSETSHHLDLAVSRDNNMYFASPETWDMIPDRKKFLKLGIVIKGEGQRFILFWNDEYDNIGYSDWYTAMETYGDMLPTKEQADLIQNCSALREHARLYGADNYGNYYWTRTECPEPDADCAYIFCPGVPDAGFDRGIKSKPCNTGVVLVIGL